MGQTVPGAWVGAAYGFTWVSQAAGDSTTATATWRRYQLCFNLCDGFAVPAAIPIHVVADSAAEVSLNSSGAVGSTGNVGTIANPGYTAPHLLNVSPALLKAGQNCFQIDVHNVAVRGNNPTGFAVTGILNVAPGKCPCAPLPIVTPPVGDHQGQATAAVLAKIKGGSKAG